MHRFPVLLSVALSAGLLLSAATASAQVTTFGCHIPQDRVDRLLGNLANITNLTNELGCKKDGPCIVKGVLSQVAKEKGLPEELFFSVAWTESNWQQWDDRGRPMNSYTNDDGLMQINRRAWGHKYDWNQIQGDVLYNARAGADILKWSYDYARRKGYRGADLWRATYAVYNGGPRAVDRPWNSGSRFRHHDQNYARHMTRKPWVAKTRGCEAPRVAQPAPQPSTTPVAEPRRRWSWAQPAPRRTTPRRSSVWSLLARYFGIA